jgi:hypothetical protein
LTGDSKLTFIHDDLDGETATDQSAGPGWNSVRSGLEALLEAGRPVALGSA